jgi:hypothetical protein
VNVETLREQVLGRFFPWCSGWSSELKQLFAASGELAGESGGCIEAADRL